MRNNTTNDTISKTRKLLEYVKPYPSPADYCTHDTRKETTGHRYLRRKIRRPYKESATESETLRRGTRRAERDTGYDYLQLGIRYFFAYLGSTAKISDWVRIKECSKSFTHRIILDDWNAPVDSFLEVCKISSVPFAYGRALVFLRKGVF